ncbi:hypothetical protein M011DRAFT_465144 [Sporormia fimetaria CBS 119925]|uniref:Uncharacterized protein n=1 Tax=Sporormia fimetaria CBS 119925 TaxID=1340428 RepID=A0A6A6VIC6_9PLEO|nr:hypothetical protein M011DRAFT_465144 [Sporormia fimetaria CBS 119925]
MCQILIQHYACIHYKPICITPCLRVLSTIERPSSSPGPYLRIRTRSISPASPTSLISPQDDHLKPLPLPPTSRTLSPANPPEWLTLLASYDPDIQYCPTFLPNDLPNSSWPCLKCYMLPEWTEYRRAWARRYVSTHPHEQHDSRPVEERSGIAAIPERVGLINVVREMDRMDTVRGASEDVRARHGREEEGGAKEGGGEEG